MIDEKGRAKALEIVFTDEPVDHAPSIVETPEARSKATITGRDNRLVSIKNHLENSASFLECFHSIELAVDEIDAKYEAETPEEEARLDVLGFKFGKRDQVLPITFDMFTRSFMAAEKFEAPKFQSTLMSAARRALDEKQFINSFRYSFLLIESLFGNGKSRKVDLKAALKGNHDFTAMVDHAVKNPIVKGNLHHSDTQELLASQPNVHAVIDHLVDKRGFYFHGNIRRKDAWKPDQQVDAEALAMLAIGIVLSITAAAASPIFEPEFGRRHYNEAIQAGAKVVFEISFKFQEPEEEFLREGRLAISTPGTKVTGKQANAVAQQFLKQFEGGAPAATLKSAECVVQGSSEKIFEITFHA